jgi:hypothetical protein
MSGGAHHVLPELPIELGRATNGAVQPATNGVEGHERGLNFRIGDFTIDEHRPMKVIVIGAGFRYVCHVSCTTETRLKALLCIAGFWQPSDFHSTFQICISRSMIRMQGWAVHGSRTDIPCALFYFHECNEA